MVNNKNDPVYQHILDSYESLSQQQRKVADYIMNNIDDVIYFPIARLMDSIGVSQATIVRFAQTLGYNGFNEFRDALFAYRRRYLSPEGRMRHSIEALDKDSPKYERITREEIAYLERAISSVDESVLNAAIDTICRAKTLYIFGLGADEHLACYLHFRLRRLKIRCQLVTSSGRNIFEHLLLLSSEDAAVVYGFLEPSVDFKRIMALLSDRKVSIILITDMQNPPVIRQADLVLHAERGERGTFPSPLVPLSIAHALIIGTADMLEDRAINALKYLGDMRNKYYQTDKFKSQASNKQRGKGI